MNNLFNNKFFKINYIILTLLTIFYELFLEKFYSTYFYKGS